MFLPRKHSKLCVLILFLVLFNLILYLEIYISKTVNDNHDIQLETRLININLKRDWHNYEAIKAALARKGPGEVGAAVDFDEYKKQLYEEYGFHATLSDQISLNRSVPDVRLKDCKNLTYLAQLPKTAIIIIFFNERRSVLLRTVHGIINRTPDELIQEIILVDDCSTYSELQDPLTDYLRINLPPERSKVRLVRIPQRAGLMVARMTGARAASKESEVLIFLDSHFEVNYNWLPPLLEPIALNPKTCTCPALDSISFKDFEYRLHTPFRGYFDWTLGYKFLALHSHEYETPAKNYYENVLMGAAIAINAEFFWDLGGFDEGMVLWGGEQFELSFKIWMCGGEIITVPCSRMAHLYRDPDTKGNTNLYGNYNFVERNFRRLMDVWMDEEHRQYVFNRRPTVKEVDAGDLSDLIAIRERLKCKSFSWMIENKMPDLKLKYPPIEPFNLAAGLLRSVFDENLCVSLKDEKNITLEACPAESDLESAYWIYNWRGEIRSNGGIFLETDIWNGRVTTFVCHETGGNQKWYYDYKTQWIAHKEYDLCMVASFDDRLVKLSECDENDYTMKWTFTHINVTELGIWEDKLK